MKEALLSLYTKGFVNLAAGGGNNGDIPDPKRNAPSSLANAVDIVLGILGWAGTAAGVAGIMITGTMMAVSMKRGEGSEHISRLGMVLGGCVLVAVAGPTVVFFFGNVGGKGGGGE
ncbi:hypothetical protein [Streptomyces sp. NPDC059850]|uniref:hypothetical protein n=1 Tax=Streptomyces sp. NPDC059850 TaxID=3346970 RepID=UPI003646EDF5